MLSPVQREHDQLLGAANGGQGRVITLIKPPADLPIKRSKPSADLPDLTDRAAIFCNGPSQRYGDAAVALAGGAGVRTGCERLWQSG
jgi:hypothetical protein